MSIPPGPDSRPAATAPKQPHARPAPIGSCRSGRGTRLGPAGIRHRERQKHGNDTEVTIAGQAAMLRADGRLMAGPAVTIPAGKKPGSFREVSALYSCAHAWRQLVRIAYRFALADRHRCGRSPLLIGKAVAGHRAPLLSGDGPMAPIWQSGPMLAILGRLVSAGTSAAALSCLSGRPCGWGQASCLYLPELKPGCLGFYSRMIF